MLRSKSELKPTMMKSRNGTRYLLENSSNPSKQYIRIFYCTPSTSLNPRFPTFPTFVNYPAYFGTPTPKRHSIPSCKQTCLIWEGACRQKQPYHMCHLAYPPRISTPLLSIVAFPPLQTPNPIGSTTKTEVLRKHLPAGS